MQDFSHIFDSVLIVRSRQARLRHMDVYRRNRRRDLRIREIVGPPSKFRQFRLIPARAFVCVVGHVLS